MNDPAVSMQPEINTFHFDAQQARLLHQFSEQIADMGGPQAIGSKKKAALAATALKRTFSMAQHTLTRQYADGRMSMLVFDGLQTITDAPHPQTLPAQTLLEGRLDILCLAARNQILLELVDHCACAYDIDNNGKIVRLVANFQGGGLMKMDAEPDSQKPSSHTGLSLGPHTDAPYWCAVTAENGHSPSPSALVLSALWNPLREPTSVIPLLPVLEQLGVINCLALTSRSFHFTRSDSFVEGKGEDGKYVSILDFNATRGFTARFNMYRFSVDDDASPFVKHAFQKLLQAVGDTAPHQHALTQHTAIVINNTRALHCRDIVKDNRRLLVRLFGLDTCSEPVVISDDPLLLSG